MHLQALSTLGSFHITTPIMTYDLEAGTTWLARFDSWSHLFSDFVLLEIPPHQARFDPGTSPYRLHISAGPIYIYFSITLFHGTL